MFSVEVRFVANNVVIKTRKTTVKTNSANSASTRHILLITERILLRCCLVFVLIPNLVSAAGAVKSNSLERFFGSSSILIAYSAGIFIIFVVCIGILVKQKSDALKKVLFGALLVAIVLPTIYFIGSTLYLNIISETRGPVHWHADFEIYACGQQITLASPQSRFSNKVGSPTFHHHDDNRIHLEGVGVDLSDFDVSSFFSTIGGELTDTSFLIPTSTGPKELHNGDLCQNQQAGTWQVFVYSQEPKRPTVFKQRKLAVYTNYILSPQEKIPPGDCIIIEFDAPKEKTEHLCTAYKVESQKGNITIE